MLLLKRPNKKIFNITPTILIWSHGIVISWLWIYFAFSKEYVREWRWGNKSLLIEVMSYSTGPFVLIPNIFRQNDIEFIDYTFIWLLGAISYRIYKD